MAEARSARTAYGTVDDLLDDCLTAALDHLLRTHGGAVWDESSYDALLVTRCGPTCTTRRPPSSRRRRRSSTSAAAITARLERLRSPVLDPAVTDIRRQLRWLVHPGFVAPTGAARLSAAPRYLAGIGARLDRLAGDVARDAERMRTVVTLQTEIEDRLLAARPGQHGDLLEMRWTIEELRVSLFAQALGTPAPVSVTRIRRQLDRLDGVD